MDSDSRSSLLEVLLLALGEGADDGAKATLLEHLLVPLQEGVALVTRLEALVDVLHAHVQLRVAEARYGLIDVAGVGHLVHNLRGIGVLRKES